MGFLDIDLSERLREINSRIEVAANKAGRNKDEIKLIAVTKYVDSEAIKKVNELGIHDFGESRVQDFLPKYEQFPEANWHFIGRLQTNKVKYIIDKVKLIHSVDSIDLAQEINARAKKKDVSVNVLIEVNISGEETKAGVEPDNCEKFIKQISKLENINVKGLMTIAPNITEKDKLRLFFGNLYKLFIDIASKKIHNIDMEYLSAGMTNDFEIAIQEGVNMVRIGMGIFGNI